MIDSENENLKELRKYQKWFGRQIQSKNWDSIANRMSDLHIRIISRVMKAENPNELNYIIWKQLDYVKELIIKIRKSL